MAKRNVQRTSDPSPSSTTLAVDRTRLAYDRTLMAWVRTSASLISLGFTIYKFFHFLRESGQQESDRRLFTPRGYALLMITIGVVTLLVATVRHVLQVRALRAEFSEVPYSLATILAGMISAFGVLALLAVFFRQ